MSEKRTASDEVFYIDAIASASEDLVIAAGFTKDPDAASSRIYFKFGKRWGSHEVQNDFIVSVAFNNGILYALGKYGVVKSVGQIRTAFDATAVKGNVQTFSIKEVPERGHMSRVRSVGEAFLACGWGGQIYLLSGNRRRTLEKGLDAQREADFLDIAGTYPSDVYAVGLSGLLAHYNGDKWRYLDSPTNNHLYSILYINDSEIYICGAEGGLYRGNRDKWTYIGDPENTDNFWSMAQYKGSLFVSHGDKGLSRVNQQRLTEIRFQLGFRPYTNRLTVGGGKLWSIGSHDLLGFDGSAWSPVICPDNE